MPVLSNSSSSAFSAADSSPIRRMLRERGMSCCMSMEIKYRVMRWARSARLSPTGAGGTVAVLSGSTVSPAVSTWVREIDTQPLVNSSARIKRVPDASCRSPFSCGH